MATVTSKLESLGYTIHARQMPGVGASNPPKDLSEDVAALRTIVEEAIGSGNDVMAIVHSWGGIVAGTGLVGLGKKEREAEGKKGGVVRVGYLAAFIVPEGVSLIDAIGGVNPPWFDVQVRVVTFLIQLSWSRNLNKGADFYIRDHSSTQPPPQSSTMTSPRRSSKNGTRNCNPKHTLLSKRRRRQRVGNKSLRAIYYVKTMKPSPPRDRRP